VQQLQSVTNHNGLKLEYVKQIRPVLVNLLNDSSNANANAEFPVPLHQFTKTSAGDDIVTEAKRAESKSDIKNVVIEHSRSRGDITLSQSNNDLCPPLAISEPGLTTVSLVIDKVGLKDAEKYIDAHIRVSIANKQGRQVGVVQDTPACNHKEDRHVLIGHTVHLQVPMEKFGDDWAVMLEFNHYKPKKKKVSTRCFAFLEKEELERDGPVALELYKKPTDFARKHVRLFSEKKLFMQLRVVLHKH
jgi:Axin interactor dorsalisation-associated protein, C-terminal